MFRDLDLYNKFSISTKSKVVKFSALLLWNANFKMVETSFCKGQNQSETIFHDGYQYYFIYQMLIKKFKLWPNNRHPSVEYSLDIMYRKRLKIHSNLLLISRNFCRTIIYMYVEEQKEHKILYRQYLIKYTKFLQNKKKRFYLDNISFHGILAKETSRRCKARCTYMIQGAIRKIIQLQ